MKVWSLAEETYNNFVGSTKLKNALWWVSVAVTAPGVDFFLRLWLLLWHRNTDSTATHTQAKQTVSHLKRQWAVRILLRGGTEQCPYAPKLFFLWFGSLYYLNIKIQLFQSKMSLVGGLSLCLLSCPGQGRGNYSEVGGRASWSCISVLFVTLGNELSLFQTDHRECTNVCLEFW